MINYTKNYINIVNDYIPKVFNSKELLSLSIEGKKNCCTELEKIKFDLVYDPSCIFTAEYQNYFEQSVCTPSVGKNPNDCVESPISSYYKNVSELYIYQGGKSKNILNKIYDMTVEAEVIALQSDIIAYFKNLNINAVVEVNDLYDINNFLKVIIKISNLPVNVKFENFILANDETCYVKVLAECDFGIRCIKTEFILPENANVYSIVTDSYEFILSNEINKISSEVELQVLNDLFFNNNLNLSFYFEGTSLQVEGINNPITYIKYKVNTDEFVSFPVCIEHEEAIPKCEYSVKIPKGDFVNAIMVYKGSDSFISPVFMEAINLNEDDIEGEFFSHLSPSNTAVEFEEDFLTIIVKDAHNIPHSVIVDEVPYLFSCNSIDYFQNNYNSKSIELTGNSILFKPDYLQGLKTGVYNIKITTETETQIITESYCIFVDLDLKCKISKLNDLEELKEAIFLYESLKNIHECSDCECENACILYQELYNILSRNSIKHEDCNC